MARESQYGPSSARVRFARAVEEKQRELLSANKTLSDLEAFRRASMIVAKENPQLLTAYREDVEKL